MCCRRLEPRDPARGTSRESGADEHAFARVTVITRGADERACYRATNMNAPRYRSETRSTTLGDLPSDLRAALVSHAEKRKLKLILASVWQTHRENPVASTMLGKLLGRRANASDPDAFHDMVLVIHASHLLLATSGRSRGTSVFSVPLLLATLTRGGLVANGHDGALERPGDDGMNIGGFSEDNGASGTGFMGLGAGPAAEACVLAATAAMADAKSAVPPS